MGQTLTTPSPLWARPGREPRLGGLALVSVVPVLVLLRRPDVTARTEPRTAEVGSRRPLRPVLGVASLGGLVLLAHFIPFTFIAELLEPSDVPTPLLLLVFGLVGAGGVGLVGVTGDKYPRAVPIVMALTMTASVASITGLGHYASLDVGLIIAWGPGGLGAWWSVPSDRRTVGPSDQGDLMRMAGSEHRATAGTLLPVAMNLGIALGARSRQRSGRPAVDRRIATPGSRTRPGRTPGFRADGTSLRATASPWPHQ